MRNQSQLSLEVCISASGNDALLLECLSSLSQQSLCLDELCVSVIASKAHVAEIKMLVEFFQFSFVRVIEIKKISAALSRNWGIKNSQASIVYFLDEDCSLKNPDHLKNLIAFHKIYPDTVIIGGRYVHGSLGTHWGQAYNYMCDTWQDQAVTENMSQQPNQFLGGNLSLKLTPETKKILFDEHLGFGGEDVKYVQDMISRGHKTWLTHGLTVMHHSQHTMKSFFSRAWLHGKVKKSTQSESLFQSLKKTTHLLKKPGNLSNKSRAALYFSTVQASYWSARSTQPLNP